MYIIKAQEPNDIIMFIGNCDVIIKVQKLNDIIMFTGIQSKLS